MKTKNKQSRELRVGKHSSLDSIAKFSGWTPGFDLLKAGFKQEYSFDLLKNYIKSITNVNGHLGIWYGNPEELGKVRTLAGSQTVLNEHKKEICSALEKLNSANTNYVLFRTYRGFPAVWDYVEIYSTTRPGDSIDIK